MLDRAGEDLGEVKDRYANCAVLDEQIGSADAGGCYERVRVVKTNMKYPLVRVVERWKSARGEPGGDTVSTDRSSRDDFLDTLLSQSAMVADHVTVQVKGKISLGVLSTEPFV